MQAYLHLSDSLKIPQSAVTETFAILAKRGKGKTYTAKVFAEELFKAKQPVCVLDPVGVWWGLRLDKSGKKAGLPFTILGGEYGDLPLEASAGKVIAKLVAEAPRAIVLDVSGFSQGEKTRFVADFAEELYRLKHKQEFRTPLMLILDEADQFAPQRPMPDENRMLGAIDRCVRLGRARGIGVTLISQRPAVIHKNVLTQTEVMIAMGMTAPQEHKAIEEWVRANGDEKHRKAMMDGLASMKTGEAWIWSPSWLEIFKRVSIREIETFNSSDTPDAKKAAVSIGKFAEIDLGSLGKEMASTVERMKADDPRALRAHIFQLQQTNAALERQLSKKPAKPEIAVKEKPVLTEKQIARLENIAAKVEALAGACREAINLFGKHETTAPPWKNYAIEAAPKVVAATRTIARMPKPPSLLGSQEVKLNSGERRILLALAQRHPMWTTDAQIGTLSGFTASGGTFRNYYRNLRRLGMIQENGNRILITEAGLSNVDPAELEKPADAIELWRSSLIEGERKMLDFLIKSYPKKVSQEELGEVTGYAASGGTFRNYYRNLRRNGLLEEEGDSVRLGEMIMKELGGRSHA